MMKDLIEDGNEISQSFTTSSTAVDETIVILL